jgi:hypothetical protein
VMVSILGHGIADISEGNTDPDSHGDEHGGLPTVISMTQEQLVGIGSDKLPSFPWDPGVHLVSRLFHLMMAQVAPESHILHSGLVLRGLAGACPMERDNFSLLILMIEYGDGWARYYFHRGTFTDAASGQQVQFPQVFQHEDPGVGDPVCIR